MGSYLRRCSNCSCYNSPNEPLGGVVLVPLHAVAVVARELVVEVVVALADRDNRGDERVARGVAVGVCRGALQ